MRWLDEKVSDMGRAEYQAAAVPLGRALVADGATAEWLLAELQTWQAVNGVAPALVDLVSKRPQCGYNTLALVQLSAMQSLAANRVAESYFGRLHIRIEGDVLQLIRRLPAGPQRFTSLKEAQETARAAGNDDPAKEVELEVATFAYDYFHAPSSEPFLAALDRFKTVAAPDVVLDALRLGARDGLYDGFSGAWGVAWDERTGPNFALLDALRTSTVMHEGLVSLFGAAGEALVAGIDNELIRLRNSEIARIEVELRRYPLFGRASARQLFGHAATELAWPALMTMALVPVDADLIARIPFPPPSGAAARLPEFQVVAGGLARSGPVSGRIRRILRRLPHVVFDMRDRLSPLQRGAAILGRALAADGITRESLADALHQRQVAGMQDIRLADLLPERAQATLAAIQKAAVDSGVANRMARSYWYAVQGNAAVESPSGFDKVRLETARDIGFDADPMMMAQAARSGGLPERTEAVAQAVMTLVISPVSEATIASLPIERPRRRPS
jgi:hypothetical protein